MSTTSPKIKKQKKLCFERQNAHVCDLGFHLATHSSGYLCVECYNIIIIITTLITLIILFIILILIIILLLLLIIIIIIITLNPKTLNPKLLENSLEYKFNGGADLVIP